MTDTSFIPEERLVAYADGELDQVDLEALAEREAEDPAFAARVDAYRRIRSTLQVAYDAILDEPVPERLRSAALAESGNVVFLERVRARFPPVIGKTAAIAASLMLGLLIGQLVWDRGDGALRMAAGGSGVVATGDLARILETRPSGEPDEAAGVVPRFSFARGESGYCRVFETRGEAAIAGLACREDGRWHLHAMAPMAAAPGEGTGLRPAAAGALPAVVSESIGRLIVGDPLGREAEAERLRSNWQPQERSESEGTDKQ